MGPGDVGYIYIYDEGTYSRSVSQHGTQSRIIRTETATFPPSTQREVWNAR